MKPKDSTEVCHHCGNADFAIARDMKFIWYCKCGRTWLPKPKTEVSPLAKLLKLPKMIPGKEVDSIMKWLDERTLDELLAWRKQYEAKTEVSLREFWIRDQYKEYGEHEGPKYVCFNHDDAEGVLIHVREVLPEPFAPPATSQVKENDAQLKDAESVEAENLENFEVKPAKYAETTESVEVAPRLLNMAQGYLERAQYYLTNIEDYNAAQVRERSANAIGAIMRANEWLAKLRVTDTAGSPSQHPLKCLPDCMMPDGADPCQGYLNQNIRIAELEARVAELQAICDKSN